MPYAPNVKRATERKTSGVVSGKPKNSKYAGICANIMSAPTCTGQPRAFAATRNPPPSGARCGLVFAPRMPRQYRNQIVLSGLNNGDFHHVADVQLTPVLHMNQAVDFWRIGP